MERNWTGTARLQSRAAGRSNCASRNDNDFNGRYPSIVKALAAMPDETVIDGEVVALDGEGRPSFSLLQNYGPGRSPLHYFIFDVLILGGRDVMGQPLMKRRELIEEQICGSWRNQSGILQSSKAAGRTSSIQ